MNSITVFITVVLVLLGIGAGLAGYTSLAFTLFVIAVIVSASLKMANNWEKFVILRAGKFQSAKGPGLFLIVPILDAVTAVIDERIQTTAFAAESGADQGHGAGQRRCHHLLARSRRAKGRLEYHEL